MPVVGKDCLLPGPCCLQCDCLVHGFPAGLSPGRVWPDVGGLSRVSRPCCGPLPPIQDGSRQAYACPTGPLPFPSHLPWPPCSILFPVPIMLLVPLRQYAMPRCFRHRRHLQELDAMHEEEAAPMSHEQAVQASKAVPLGPRQHVFC